jgi:transmembrane sensor
VGTDPVGETSRKPVSRRGAAEAAAWVAKLHGPGRSPAMERELRDWLDQAEEHRIAFERCTEVWQTIPRLTVKDAYSAAPRRSRTWQWVAVAAAGVLFAGAWFWPTADSYVTDIGESRQVLLADGSRVFLNTSTTLRVALRKERREIDVEQGEALFEVATDPERPFVVRAGKNEVTALGTVFTVRKLPYSADALVVTLVEGRVQVSPVPSATAPESSIALEPGQRLQLAGTTEPPRLDRPRVDKATAWTRQQVVLDDVSLAEAVEEMNRYSRRKIVLAQDQRLAALRVSGVYRTGDSEGFAVAVAALHGLRPDRQNGGIVIRHAKQ